MSTGRSKKEQVFFFLMFFFYRPQTKFAKVMFSQVSDCPRGGDLCPGRSLSGSASFQGVSVQGSLCPGCLCPGGSMSREFFVQGGLCSEGVSVRETPLYSYMWAGLGGTHPTRGHESFLRGHCYPCFRLLVTSPLDFKSIEGSVIHAWQMHAWGMS